MDGFSFSVDFDENYDIPFGNGILPQYPDDPIIQTMDSVYRAVDEGILPERIYQGSSGSYFVRDVDMVGNEYRVQQYSCSTLLQRTVFNSVKFLFEMIPSHSLVPSFSVYGNAVYIENRTP